MILTSQEAADALNFGAASDLPDKVIGIFLPAVDSYITNATGKDWAALTTTYTAIDPLAKMVASVILARWFEDPSQIGSVADSGVVGMIAQLKASV